MALVQQKLVCIGVCPQLPELRGGGILGLIFGGHADICRGNTLHALTSQIILYAESGGDHAGIKEATAE